MMSSSIGLASLALPEKAAEGGGLLLEEIGLLLCLEVPAISAPLKAGRRAHKSEGDAGGGDGAAPPAVPGIDPARLLDRQAGASPQGTKKPVGIRALREPSGFRVR
jgi:hypothetical protein